MSDSLAPIMLLFVNMYFQCLISDMKEKTNTIVQFGRFKWRYSWKYTIGKKGFLGSQLAWKIETTKKSTPLLHGNVIVWRDFFNTHIYHWYCYVLCTPWFSLWMIHGLLISSRIKKNPVKSGSKCKNILNEYNKNRIQTT